MVFISFGDAIQFDCVHRRLDRDLYHFSWRQRSLHWPLLRHHSTRTSWIATRRHWCSNTIAYGRGKCFQRLQSTVHLWSCQISHWLVHILSFNSVITSGSMVTLPSLSKGDCGGNYSGQESDIITSPNYPGKCRSIEMWGKSNTDNNFVTFTLQANIMAPAKA